MSLRSMSLRRPMCLSCISRLTIEAHSGTTGPSYIQVRGKKKARDPGIINVRLLVDVPGFGKKGTITPVARGRMRNSWFHRGQAEYITASNGVNPRTVIAERDFTFGLSNAEAKDNLTLKELHTADDEATKHSRRVVKHIRALTANEKRHLIITLLPARLVFHKTVISEASTTSSPSPQTTPADPPSPPSISPPTRGRATSSAAHELELAFTPPPTPPKAEIPGFDLQAIFGSLTPAEIATAMITTIREHTLTEQEATAAQYLTISPEDITIVGRADVKAEFEIDSPLPASHTSARSLRGHSLQSETRETGAKTKISLSLEEIERREGLGVEDNRIKALGDYWVDVRIGGESSEGTNGEKVEIRHDEGNEREGIAGAIRKLVRVEQ